MVIPTMFLKWVYGIILGSQIVFFCAAMKCYTCGEYDEDIPCSKFHMDDPQFIRECDTGSKSCRLSREVNGNIIRSRSCEPLQLDDCKIANSIEFCYCTNDLCNKMTPFDDQEDDEEFLEDALEGSGTKIGGIDSTTETKQSNENILPPTGKTDVNLHESIGKNTISSSCSVCPYFWCLISITMLNIYCIIKQY